MKTELYKALKGLDIGKLSEEDKEELLRFFLVTKNDLIRNQIAFIFSDTKYNAAIPFILEKINDNSISHNIGSLVYALETMDVANYFMEFIKIICEKDYEPRYQAYEIVKKLAFEISYEIRMEALQVLRGKRISLELSPIDKGPESTLSFVEQTMELLEQIRL